MPKVKHAIDLYKSLIAKPATLDKLDNHWIWGPSGSGKSSGARTRWPDLYNKPLNKWWCDYQGEATVLLDDLGKDRLVLGTHLKQWADHYPFTAETKGGGVRIRPERIVVTSNYHPNEIFQDQTTIEAITRRFQITH